MTIDFKTSEYIVTKIKCETKAKWFKDVRVGDVVSFKAKLWRYGTNDIVLINHTQDTTHENVQGTFFNNLTRILEIEEVAPR